MTETFLTLVADYGIAIIAASAFLSCLLVPIPTALVMIAGGAFAAAGDLNLTAVLLSGWAAAVLGDQTGYRIGRALGPTLKRKLIPYPKAARTFDRAEDVVDRHGGLAIFFTTWALAPLGPYANLAAGAGGLGVLRFTIWDALGEAIWVGAYVLLGYSFAAQLTDLASLMSNVVGFVLAGAIALGLGYLLVQRARQNDDIAAE